MDSSSRSIVLNLFKQIIEWRTEQSATPFFELWWDQYQLSIVRDYFMDLSTMCDFRGPPCARLFNATFRYAGLGSTVSRAVIGAFFALNLEGFFKVPRLNEFHASRNRVNQYQLLHVFFSFLLRLLHYTFCLDGRPFDPVKELSFLLNPCGHRQITDLGEELRFLLTFLGDTPLMLRACGYQLFEEVMLAQLEAVANEAGLLVYSFVFSMERAYGEMDEAPSVASNNINILKANIKKFLDLLPPSGGLTHTTWETSVVDSLLVLDSLIDDLKDLMNREGNPVSDVKDQITILYQGLTFLQSLVKDIRQPQPSEIEELRRPLMRVGGVAHEAEHLIISFLAGDAPPWYLIRRLVDVNRKIQFIGAHLQEVTTTNKFGGLKLAERFNAQQTFQAKWNLEADDITVGFEDEMVHILDQLVGGTESLRVISIFGMPGLGKTTLAKKLYDHPAVKCKFDRLSWSVISQKYQTQSILTAILIHIRSEFDKDEILKMEKASLGENIHKTLKGRRYLIVLDDIWDSSVWDDLLRYFPDDGNGSRILFTTRNRDVAPPNSTIYAPPCLSNDECWELLEKKVFGGRPCPPTLQGIGREIAANCCGLPLTVVVIAGILSTMEKEESTWEEVAGNLASYIFYGGDNSVVQILELSYKHLPVYLKPCFLYFGAFHEDEEIPVRDLMRLWIAEGFIRKEGEKNAENVAEEYLMELIDRSLVMVARRRSSDGGVRSCFVHDLLYDLCLKRSEEENFMKFVNSDDCSMYNKCHRLRALEHSVTRGCCQHVRSFHGRDLLSPLYVCNMKLLRVLRFDYIDNCYVGIDILINVRYLVICDLSASIGSLVNLEYLRVETSKEVCLPPAITKMTKLRYIQADSGAKYDEECSNSLANNLEFLSRVTISEPEDGEMLRCSPNLRRLKCRGGIMGIVKRFDIGFFTRLESLNVGFKGCSMGGISLPSTIRKLTLSSTWLRAEHMSMIGGLENLEVFKLISSKFERERWDVRDGEFQKLRFLKLEETNLTRWNVDASEEYFPELRRLELRDCPDLEEIPSEIGEIATMRVIEVVGRCTESLVESAKRIQQEQLDMENEELRVIIDSFGYF